MDIGLILAATAQEPGVFSWLGWKLLAWLGVGGGLTFVIFVHELGHFLVAKACGVKCEKFYVGFDFFEFKHSLHELENSSLAPEVSVGRNGVWPRQPAAGRLCEDARPGRRSA